MVKKIISILICIVLILPTVVFADDPFSGDKSYVAVSSVSKTVLNVLSWFGYAIALRNANVGWNKIYDEHRK